MSVEFCKGIEVFFQGSYDKTLIVSFKGIESVFKGFFVFFVWVTPRTIFFLIEAIPRRQFFLDPCSVRWKELGKTFWIFLFWFYLFYFHSVRHYTKKKNLKDSTAHCQYSNLYLHCYNHHDHTIKIYKNKKREANLFNLQGSCVIIFIFLNYSGGGDNRWLNFCFGYFYGRTGETAVTDANTIYIRIFAFF